VKAKDFYRPFVPPSGMVRGVRNEDCTFMRDLCRGEAVEWRKKMKKRAVISVMLVLTMILLVACGGGNSGSKDTGTSDTDTSSSSSSEETAAPTGDIPTIRLGHGGSETFSAHYAALKFKEICEDAGEGSINVEIYPNASLGPENEMMESCMIGNLDIAASIMNFTVSSVLDIPEMMLYEMPWLITDEGLLYDLFENNETFKTITTEKFEEKGIKFLGVADIGWYGVAASSPIGAPDDMKNKKIRTAENPLIVDWMGALKCNPTVVSISEVYTALQQGVIDGIYTTMTMMSQTKSYEVAKEVTGTKNALGVAYLCMNLEKFNSMTPAQQETLIAAGKAFAEEQHRARAEEEDRVIKEMVDEGASYKELDLEQIKPFQEAVQPVYDKWRITIGEDFFSDTEQFIAEWEASH
jgi:TRAP-type C4-dicarboxylate transport system substrate-binding protein